MHRKDTERYIKTQDKDQRGSESGEVTHNSRWKTEGEKEREKEKRNDGERRRKEVRK